MFMTDLQKVAKLVAEKRHQNKEVLNKVASMVAEIRAQQSMTKEAGMDKVALKPQTKFNLMMARGNGNIGLGLDKVKNKINRTLRNTADDSLINLQARKLKQQADAILQRDGYLAIPEANKLYDQIAKLKVFGPNTKMSAQGYSKLYDAAFKRVPAQITAKGLQLYKFIPKTSADFVEGAAEGVKNVATKGAAKVKAQYNIQNLIKKLKNADLKQILNKDINPFKISGKRLQRIKQILNMHL